MIILTGDPFHFRYWLAQCAIYLLVMLVEKVCVGPLILFDFWSKVSQCRHTWPGFVRENLYYVLCVPP